MKLKLAACLGLVPLFGLVGACDLANKRTKPIPSVMVEAPHVSDAWKQVASAADRDRIDRLGLAWQQGIADAKPKFA